MREVERQFWLAVLWLAAVLQAESAHWLKSARARLAELEGRG